MEDKTISLTEAGLLIQRFVAGRIPVLAWLVSADRSVKVKMRGFVTGFTRDVGMAITTESPTTKPGTLLPAFVMISHLAVAKSVFRYSNGKEIPADSVLGSGLRLDLPNGDTLTIAEIQPH
jgi:hypothetical protein